MSLLVGSDGKEVFVTEEELRYFRFWYGNENPRFTGDQLKEIAKNILSSVNAWTVPETSEKAPQVAGGTTNFIGSHKNPPGSRRIVTGNWGNFRILSGPGFTEDPTPIGIHKDAASITWPKAKGLTLFEAEYFVGFYENHSIGKKVKVWVKPREGKVVNIFTSDNRSVVLTNEQLITLQTVHPDWFIPEVVVAAAEILEALDKAEPSKEKPGEVVLVFSDKNYIIYA